MGFKEVVKVHLSSIGADSLADDFSKAKWHLVAPVAVPNNNYKMKLQVSNASFPSSYERISPARQNNVLTIAFDWFSADFDLDAAMTDGRYIRVVLPAPFLTINTAILQKEFNEALMKACDEHVTLAGMKRRPWLYYDGTPGTVSTGPAYNTFALV
jgi:hypothetical protein